MCLLWSENFELGDHPEEQVTSLGTCVQECSTMQQFMGTEGTAAT